MARGWILKQLLRRYILQYVYFTMVKKKISAMEKIGEKRTCFVLSLELSLVTGSVSGCLAPTAQGRNRALG